MRGDPLHLLGRLDRARPGKQDRRPGADRHVADADPTGGDEVGAADVERLAPAPVHEVEGGAENRTEDLAHVGRLERAPGGGDDGVELLLLAPRVVRVEAVPLLEVADVDYHLGAPGAARESPR
jgi:hypothetical protein